VSEAPTSAASFDWFWQPPLSGEPGIMMIVDTHPGPDAVAVPFVAEDLNNVLLVCESRIPQDVHLYQLRIYVRDILDVWIQIEFTLLGRSYTKKAPDFSQGDLEQVWENHVLHAGRA
jgi:hypothetical protein